MCFKSVNSCHDGRVEKRYIGIESPSTKSPGKPAAPLVLSGRRKGQYGNISNTHNMRSDKLLQTSIIDFSTIQIQNY